MNAASTLSRWREVTQRAEFHDRSISGEEYLHDSVHDVMRNVYKMIGSGMLVTDLSVSPPPPKKHYIHNTFKYVLHMYTIS